MAERNDGDKTEKPTPKRLKDARKKGNVAKSREVTSTVVLLTWLVIGAFGVSEIGRRLAQSLDRLLDTIGKGWADAGFATVLAGVAAEWSQLLLVAVAMLLVPAIAVGLLTEYLQAGPVMSFEKIKPKIENLDPIQGLERMFSIDNLVELVKSVVKTALLLAIGWLVVSTLMPQITGVAAHRDIPAVVLGKVAWEATFLTVVWTVAVFALLAALDAGWQHYRFVHKLRMSRRDIREEHKESEGDPLVKQQRRQAHAEWSQRNAQNAARAATALVVNPTHVAIAIDYDKQACPVPTVSAKGEDHVARAMREAAEEAGVPIVRNVPLARDMLARADVGEMIPPDLFDVMAEVIVWAREVRAQLAYEEAMANAASRGEERPDARPERKVPAPGEDLTHYPDSLEWRRAVPARDRT
jgi:flagellar biosynthetic protein FlhB/type III secretion protein U